MAERILEEMTYSQFHSFLSEFFIEDNYVSQTLKENPSSLFKEVLEVLLVSDILFLSSDGRIMLTSLGENYLFELEKKITYGC